MQVDGSAERVGGEEAVYSVTILAARSGAHQAHFFSKTRTVVTSGVEPPVPLGLV